MTIILASLCSLLVSCATLTSLTGGSETPSETAALEDGAAAPPAQDLNLAPAGTVDQTYASQEVVEPGQVAMEAQAAEHQEIQASVMNEQRSNSELDAAAPETTTDAFAAGGQASADVEQVLPEIPAELPQKQVASWSHHSSFTAGSYEEPKREKHSYKKSKKSTKSSMKAAKASKHDKKKIAKNSKKSKKHVAKHSKKSNKVVAKKSKVDCKKIAKNSKKSSKREIASCKAEKKKVASKSHKIGKVAKAGCQCDYR
jgi:hypothetical protein